MVIEKRIIRDAYEAALHNKPHEEALRLVAQQTGADVDTIVEVLAEKAEA